MATAGDHAGSSVARHTPSLAAAYPALAYSPTERVRTGGLDVVFLALPHGRSQQPRPRAVPGGVDRRPGRRLPAAGPRPLPGLVRTKPMTRRSCSDGSSTASPSSTARTRRRPADRRARLLPDGRHPRPRPAARGRADRRPAGAAGRAAARRGCGQRGVGSRPGAEGHAPLRRRGRGLHRLRAARPPPHARDGAGLGASVLFTPHLAPMVRGSWPPATPTRFAAGEPGAMTTADGPGHPPPAPTTTSAFVVVTEDSPSTKATTGSNCAHVTVRVDARTGWVVVIAALDNLVKGAAGPGRPVRQPGSRPGRGDRAPVAGVYP